MVVSCDNVIVDTIKKAEDHKSLIVRCYEAFGMDGPCEIQFRDPVQSIQLVNLMESLEQEIKVKNNRIRLNFTPFEILTLRVNRV